MPFGFDNTESNQFITGTITATNGTVTLPVYNCGSCQIVLSGTFVDSLLVEGTADGTLWNTLHTATGAAGIYTTSAITATGKYRVHRTAGLTQIRVRSNAHTSGTVSVLINADEPVGTMEVVQLTAANLQTTTNINTTGSGVAQFFTSKLRYIDMNASNGGVARGSTITSSAWTNVFSYSGSGVITGWLVNLAISTNWLVRFIIDGEEIFGSAGILSDDVVGTSLYHMNSSGTSTDDAPYGLSISSDDRFMWRGPLSIPVRFASDVSIKLKRVSSNSTITAGLVIIQKET